MGNTSAGKRIPDQIREMTTVSKTIRRIGRFDWELASQASLVNRPTKIAINGLDYLDHRDRDCRSTSELSTSSREFIEQLNDRLGNVSYLGVGPAYQKLLNRRNSAMAEDPVLLPMRK